MTYEVANVKQIKINEQLIYHRVHIFRHKRLYNIPKDQMKEK